MPAIPRHKYLVDADKQTQHYWRRITAILLLSLCLSGCSRWYFFPDRHIRLTPGELGLDYRDIALTAADGTALHAWFLPAHKPVKGSILFLHGNAENVSTHIHNIRWLPAEGYQVLLLDYRGFGRSQGQPGFPEVFLDIAAAIEWLKDSPETGHTNLYIIGQSIGASLMHYAMLENIYDGRLCALISDAAFARYGDISRHIARQSWLTWPVQYPIAWAMSNGHDPVDALTQLSSLPILFIHSRDDSIVPFSNLGQLTQAHGGANRQLVTRGPHTATFNSVENRETALRFMVENACANH